MVASCSPSSIITDLVVESIQKGSENNQAVEAYQRVAKVKPDKAIVASKNSCNITHKLDLKEVHYFLIN